MHVEAVTRTTHPCGRYNTFALHNARYSFGFIVASKRRNVLCARKHSNISIERSLKFDTCRRIAFFHGILAQTKEMQPSSIINLKSYMTDELFDAQHCNSNRLVFVALQSRLLGPFSCNPSALVLVLVSDTMGRSMLPTLPSSSALDSFFRRWKTSIFAPMH